MMKLRQDLLELSINALTAIANAGFVKRAQKDLAAGAGPTLSQSEALDVQAEFADGTITRLAATQSISEADCNCSATSMCRHKVMLVLAYQAQQQSNSPQSDANSGADSGGPIHEAGSYWSPTEFDDQTIKQCFNDSVHAQAYSQTQQTCLARVIPARLQADAKSYSDPAVQLAMNHVRFFSRSSPAQARCDCQQASGCSHILLALWAFRQAQQQLGAEVLADTVGFDLEVRAPGEASANNSNLLETNVAQQTLGQVEEFLWRLWQHGSAQNLTVLEIAYQAVLAQLQPVGWTWLSLNLQAIWQQLLAQAARSSRYDAQLVLSLVSQCQNRLSAARYLQQQAQPTLPLSKLLGIGQAGEVQLDSLRLISLGAEFWFDQAQIGASLVFADSDTQVVSVLEKSWPLAQGEIVSRELILNKRIANFPLRQLAIGQIISKSAKRRANAQLELSSNQRLSSILPMSAKSWEHLREPLKWSDLSALSSYLQQGLPDFVREFQAQASYRVIEVGQFELLTYYWQGAEQSLCIIWQDQHGMQLQVSVNHSALSDTAVDQAASALAGDFGAILACAGPVELRGGYLFMQARSMICTERALVLAVPAAANTNGAKPDFDAAPEQTISVLQQTRQEFAQLLRSGLFSSNHHARRRLSDCVTALQAEAYLELAKRLHDLLQLLLQHGDEQNDFLSQAAEFDALLCETQKQ